MLEALPTPFRKLCSNSRPGAGIRRSGGVRELRSLQPPDCARIPNLIADLAGLSVQHQMKNDVTFDASIAVRRLFICMLT